MIVTARQMKQIEEEANAHCLSMERLMENAGSAAAATIRRAVDVNGRCVTIFCGNGNNGGDGLVVARRLTEAGANAVVVLTDGQPRTQQALNMMERIQLMEISVLDYGENISDLAERLAQTDILVDAIYGTGFHGIMDSKHQDICRLLCGVGAPIFALDIPSGVIADNGVADQFAICAQYTIVFDSYKPATVLPCAATFCGKVILADIGIPSEAHKNIVPEYTLVDAGFTFSCLKARIRETHKGDYGKLLNIAGSQKYMGAAVLSTLAALRTGAGYVTLASTKEVCRTVLPMIIEAVMLPLKQNQDGAISFDSMQTMLETIENSTAILVGNGLGTGPDAYKIIYEILEKASCPLVIDADGINVISRNIDILKNTSCQVILTPHMKELSRLTTIPIPQLKQDLLTVGKAFAKEYGAVLVVKDAYTVTITPEGHTYINTTGNAGLAKAGSGDVLAGIIGSICAQGLSTNEAAACGVFLHGMAGDFAASEKSQYGMLPRDVIDALTTVFLENGR